MGRGLRKTSGKYATVLASPEAKNLLKDWLDSSTIGPQQSHVVTLLIRWFLDHPEKQREILNHEPGRRFSELDRFQQKSLDDIIAETGMSEQEIRKRAFAWFLFEDDLVQKLVLGIGPKGKRGTEAIAMILRAMADGIEESDPVATPPIEQATRVPTAKELGQQQSNQKSEPTRTLDDTDLARSQAIDKAAKDRVREREPKRRPA